MSTRNRLKVLTRRDWDRVKIMWKNKIYELDMPKKIFEIILKKYQMSYTTFCQKVFDEGKKVVEFRDVVVLNIEIVK